MPKLPSLIALVLVSGAALAQTTQPGQTTPSVTPSDTPAVTPSQTPAPQAPVVVVVPQSQPPAVVVPGGMSQCQNMIGGDRDKCLQEEQRPAAASGTGGRAAGAGGSHAPGGTGTGAGTAGAQSTAPAGSIR